MDDIDRAKALAALEQLEAERARRLQAKIDAGEMVKIEAVVVAAADEDLEDATARAIAKPHRMMGVQCIASFSTFLRASHGATRISQLRKYKQLPRRGRLPLLRNRLRVGR